MGKMSEIANDMVDGACCCLCGVYFENENGFPVLCASCWKEYGQKVAKSHNGLPPITPEGWQQSLEKEI
jgi:hypothetical protein